VKGRIEAERLTVCEGARLEGDLVVGRVEGKIE
jgi:cytoskeletal protein CcmA (bactofilin family)